jgi:hypothetical protein
MSRAQVVAGLLVGVLVLASAALVVDLVVGGGESSSPGPEGGLPEGELTPGPGQVEDWLALGPDELLMPRANATFDDGRVLRTRTEEVGSLTFPTGELMIFEPGWVAFEDLADEWIRVPDVASRGRLLVNRVRSESFVRVGAAAVVFGSLNDVAAWQRLDQRLGVDAGMGGFADAGALEELQDAYDIEDTTYYEEIAAEVIESGFAPAVGPSYALDSGMGDGAYDVWVGRSVGGEVEVVIVDFELLHHAESLEPVGRKRRP